MDQQRKEQLRKNGILFLRSALFYLLFALFSLLASYRVPVYNYDSYGHYYFLPDTAIYVICTLLPLLFYYLLIRATAMQSGAIRARFAAIWDRKNPPGFLRQMKFIFSSPEFRSDLILHLLLLLVFPAGFGFRPLVLLLGNYGNKGVVFAIIAPSLALICIAARLSVLSAWTVQWGGKIGGARLEKIPLWKLPLWIFLTWVFCTILGAVAPITVRSVYALFQILKLAPRTFFLILIGAILLWYLIRLMDAVRKRLRFLRRLRKFCKENGFELTCVKRCFITLLFPISGVNVSLKKGDRQYDCRLISSLRRHSPLHFEEEGVVTCTHVYKFFSLHLFHFDLTYRYQFEATGTKILVLVPVPNEVFVSGYGEVELGYSGSRVSDCILYGATDFIHALERGVVGR